MQENSSQYSTIFLLFGILKAFKPCEPFLFPYLTIDKNLTREQVSNQVFPIWDYAHWIFVPIMAFLAENPWFGSYKLVIILEAIGHMATRLILIFGYGLRWMQVMQITFALGTSADLIYYAFVFKAFPLANHRKMTGLSHAAVLMGRCTGSLLGQVLVNSGFDFKVLFCMAAISTFMACIVSLWFPGDAEVKQLRLLLSPSSTPSLEVDDDDDDDNTFTTPQTSPSNSNLWRILQSSIPVLVSATVVPMLLNAFNLVFSYSMQTYSPTVWLERDNVKILNGYADFGASGLGALGSMASWLFIDKTYKWVISDSDNLQQSRLSHHRTSYFILSWIRNLVISIALAGCFFMALVETTSTNIYISYAVFVLAMGFSGLVGSASSSWMGSNISQLNGIGREKHAILFSFASFSSSGIRAILQLILSSLNLSAVNRLWVYTGIVGFVTLVFVCYSVISGIIGRVMQRHDYEVVSTDIDYDNLSREQNDDINDDENLISRKDDECVDLI